MKKLLAFTLAETLIVMGVIGVVAALTLPNLNQSTNNKEKVAKVKKIYSNLNDAFGRTMAVYGPFDEWKNKGTDTLGKRVSDFLKISKDCGNHESGCTSPSNFKLIDGQDSGENLAMQGYCLLLADGTSLTIGFSTVFVDIDGPNKGTNTFGKDIFLFPLNDSGEFYFPDYFGYSRCFSEGSTCSRWVLDFGNMDYLKANTSGKCTNGTQLSETVTSCN